MLVPHTGGTELVKLLDFGIAKIGGSGGLTREGSMLGTPQYMAPEQVQGLPVDARADVYALGLVAYELLAGRPAFESDNTIGYVHLHMNVEPPPLSAVVPDAAVPFSIEQCIRRALAKDPRQRTPSVAAFASELQMAMAGAQAPRPQRSSGTVGIVLAIGLGATIIAGGVLGAAFVLADDDDEPEVVADTTDGAPSTPDDPDSKAEAEPPKSAASEPFLDHWTPEERALYSKSVPELEAELRRVAVKSVGEAYADSTVKQATANLSPPPGIDPEPYQKQVLVRTIVALRDSAKVVEATLDAPDESVAELEEKYLSMECSLTVEERRRIANQIRLGMPKGATYEPILKQYFAQFIEACEQGEQPAE
jgi:serine/threonine protein kinase